MATSPPDPAVKAWRDLDQASLDQAYDQAHWAPNMAEVLQRYADRSERFRAEFGPPRRLAYGPTEIEALDFFDCGRPGAPLLVFFHGGAWRSGKARDYAFVARPFVRAGVHVAVPDFAWVQDCGGDLRPVVEQARRALAWVHAHAQRLSGDGQRIHLCGHSSGAHLAALLATTDWTGRGLPADLVKGALLCSGMYELEPVRRSARSRYVRIDDDAVQTLSPIRQLAHARQPLMVAWGAHESPEFRRQGSEFAGAAQARGIDVRALEVADVNHFELLETFADPDAPLGRVAELVDLSW